MRNEDLFKRFLAIFDELERIDKEQSTDSGEELNPQVSQLTLEGKRIISELDPSSSPGLLYSATLGTRRAS